MDKETINKAAEEFAEREYETSSVDRDYLHKGFYHHGEELKRNVHVIARIKRGFCIGRFDVVGYFHEYIGFITQSGIEFPLSDILEYAYLDDITPKRKGGAQ